MLLQDYLEASWVSPGPSLGILLSTLGSSCALLGFSLHFPLGTLLGPLWASLGNPGGLWELSGVPIAASLGLAHPHPAYSKP